MGNAFELKVKLASLKVKRMRPFQTKNDWLSGECEKMPPRKRQRKKHVVANKGRGKKAAAKNRGREKRQPDLSKVSKGSFWSILAMFLDCLKDLSGVSMGSI